MNRVDNIRFVIYNTKICTRLSKTLEKDICIIFEFRKKQKFPVLRNMVWVATKKALGLELSSNPYWAPESGNDENDLLQQFRKQFRPCYSLLTLLCV